MKHFHIGQRVRIVRGIPDGFVDSTGFCDHASADESTIKSDLVRLGHNRFYPFLDAETMVHMLDLVSRHGRAVVAPPEWLEPIDDGREPVAWSDIAEFFVPGKVTRKENA